MINTNIVYHIYTNHSMLLLPLFYECDKNSPAEKLNVNFSQKFVLVVSALITLLLGICPEMLIELCKFIAYNI